jgi:hypothetical protein
MSSAKPLDIILAVFACLAGMAAPVWAFALAGGGHGWVSPLWPSLGVLLAGAAWLGRKQPLSLLLSFFLALVFAAGDSLLWSRTQQEGLGYFWKAWHYGPSIVVLWFSAWLYPQALVATVFGYQLMQWLGAGWRRRDAMSPP